MIYTDVETHRANLRERWRVLRLMWVVAGERDALPPVGDQPRRRAIKTRERRAVRRLAVRTYVFRLHPQVSTYVVGGRDA